MVTPHHVGDRGAAGTAGHSIDADAADSSHESLVATVRGTPVRGLLSPPAVSSAELLTAAEVARALGFTVVLESHTVPGPMASTIFRTEDRKRAVLLLHVSEGPLAAMAWRSNSRGQQVPGIDDGAWRNGNRAVARKGDTVVLMTLAGTGKGRGDQLPQLLRQAIARVGP